MRITSDGTSKGTKVYDDYGNLFKVPILRIRWTIDADSTSRTTLDVLKNDFEKGYVTLLPFKNVELDFHDDTKLDIKMQSYDVIQSEVGNLLDPILDSLEGIDVYEHKKFVKDVLVNAVLEWLRQLPSDKKAEQC